MGYTVPLWRQQYRFPTSTVEKARGALEKINGEKDAASN
jgi:hypothetical protein